MIDLLESPYNYDYGDLIVARARVTNAVGTSEFSDDNTSGLDVMGPPLTPANIEIDDASSDESQIALDLPQPTIQNTGGSAITSYHLQWDRGEGLGVFYTIYGEDPYDTTQRYVATTVTAYVQYKFKYRTRNIFGWSSYSAETIAVPGIPPLPPTNTETINYGLGVKVQWISPYNADDSRFDLEVLTNTGTTYHMFEN
jgi:hypothetical protein